MASFMPAAWSPCAMDQAIERLLATPKTTALRPCRSEDMSAPWNGKEYQQGTVIYHGDARRGEKINFRLQVRAGSRHFDRGFAGPVELEAHHSESNQPAKISIASDKFLGPHATLNSCFSTQ